LLRWKGFFQLQYEQSRVGRYFLLKTVRAALDNWDVHTCFCFSQSEALSYACCGFFSLDSIANKLHMQKVSDFALSPGAPPSKVRRSRREGPVGPGPAVQTVQLIWFVLFRLLSTSPAPRERRHLCGCISTRLWEDRPPRLPTRASSRRIKSACSGTRKV